LRHGEFRSRNEIEGILNVGQYIYHDVYAYLYMHDIYVRKLNFGHSYGNQQSSEIMLCIYICEYVHMHMYMCIHKYIYIHIYVHT